MCDSEHPSTLDYIHLAASIVALVLLLADYVWCFRQERAHIWSSAFSLYQIFYVFQRYFPIVCQAINIGLLSYFVLPFPLHLCQKWFLFLHISSACTQFVFQITWSFLVLGLYEYNRKIILLTIFMVLVDTMVLCLGGIMLFRASALFDASCATKFDIYMVSLPASFLSQQTISWMLVCYRYRQMTGSEIILQRAPYLPGWFQNRSIVLIIMAVGVGIAIPFSILVRIDTLAVYPWSTVILSLSNCHFILKTRQSEARHTANGGGSIELDSVSTLSWMSCLPTTTTMETQEPESDQSRDDHEHSLSSADSGFRHPVKCCDSARSSSIERKSIP